MLLNPLTVELATFLRREVNLQLRLRAAKHVLDWLGCAIYGLRFLHAKSLLAYLKDVPEGKATAIGAGRKYFEQAAFHNGCLGSIADFEDFHRCSSLQPGAVVIPAALSVAEHVGASGAQLLDAIVRGYEVMIRVGQFLGPKHGEFFHHSSSAGAFGAAMAAASLLELSEEQCAWALGNAGSRTGGLLQMRAEPCMTKALHTGMAVQSGVLAALLAKRNFTGPKYLLEGPKGLFKAIAPDGSPIEIIYDMDAEWRIADVSFRPWPVARHSQAAIDAALKAKARLGANQEIAKVRVETHAQGMQAGNRPTPNFELEAKASLQHAVATALVKTRPALEDFAPPFEHAKVNAMRARIALSENSELSAAYPQQHGAAVELHLLDGSIVREQLADSWGDPAWPLSVAEIESKQLQLLLKVGVPPSQVSELAQATKQLPEAKNLHEFSKRLERVQAA